MYIGVLSDTHGRQLSLRRALNCMKDIQLIFHLGDYTRDAKYIQDTEDIPVIYVRGNCDYRSEAKSHTVCDIGKNKIFLTHGHLYNVKFGYEDLAINAKKAQANIVLFGHTHVPEIFEKYGMLFVNPGSVGEPRAGAKSTYAILKVEGDRIVPHIKKL